MRSTPDISPLLPDEKTVRARRAALTDAVAGPRRGRRPVKVRRIAVAVAALIALSGGAAIAAGVFSADEVAVDGGIGCYDRPSLRANVTITRASADPVAKCAKFWLEGVVDTRRGPASPHLVACTAEGKPVYVFPGPDGVCDRLGLVPLPDDYAAMGGAQNHAYGALHKIGEQSTLLELRDRFPNSSCLSPRAAADLARSRLAAIESDVSVAIDGDGPCVREYKVAGDQIVVATFSRREGAAEREAARIGDALGSLIEGFEPGSCRSPDAFVREARRRLAAAGLADVTVTMARDLPCVAGAYSIDGARRSVEFISERRLSYR